MHSRTKRRSTAGTSRRRSSYTPGTPSRHARVSTDAAAAAAAAAAASACGGGGVVGEEGRADSAAEKGFAEVLAKNPNRVGEESRSETLRLWQRRILIESAQQCIQIEAIYW